MEASCTPEAFYFVVAVQRGIKEDPTDSPLDIPVFSVQSKGAGKSDIMAKVFFFYYKE